MFTQPGTGAESDLKQATSLARRMVGLWGMSGEMGPVWYGVGDSHSLAGREISEPRDYAEATAARMDDVVRSLLEGAHRQALDSLGRRR